LSQNQSRAILLMGATATGKTDLAVHLVERFPVEIISVDSALIYREMDIGTAKPDASTLQVAPHYLIDILDPAQSWSAWDFVQQAVALIHEINERGNIPLLVGGTMMYFNALQQGLNDLPMADEQVREVLNQRLEQEGLSQLYNELSQVDPESAKRIRPTDPQRILRALEVFKISGRTMSQLIAENSGKPDIDFQTVILDVADRKPLHQRIEKRFHAMLDQGFQSEVEKLYQRGDLNLQMPSMRCVGYRQMWMYFDGVYSYQQMVDKSIVATRQLAKRQLTWLRKYQQALKLDYNSYTYGQVAKYLGFQGAKK
jgi:tRNA dimethylallyltransferase